MVYCTTVGSILKKFENVCSLLFICCFLILFGRTMALLRNNSKSSERGQLQAWPERLNSDFMRMREKHSVCVCVCVFMCSCVCVHPCVHSIKHSDDVPVCLHEVIRLSPSASSRRTERHVSRRRHSGGGVLI